MDKLKKVSALFHIPLAMLICYIIESLSRHSALAGLLFIKNHPMPYIFNSFVIFVLLSLTYLFKRQMLARIIISVLTTTMGVINCIILINRVTPFGFTDLAMIGDLLTMQNTKYFTAGQALVSIIVFVLFVAFCVFFFIKGKKSEHVLPTPLRVGLVVLAFASLPFVTIGFQRAGFLETYFGNLAQGYLDNGYLYGFGTSFIGRGMRKPIGYSQARVKQILRDNKMGDSTDEVHPNIVVVLLESFYDIDESDFIHCSEDPIPYTHKLEKKYSSGHLTVPVVGAGTCNTEFEVLTGMSCQFFGPGEYPQKTILKKTDCESVADVLGYQGYGTHVVHNNGGNFYSRANAFSQMGFDTFTSKELLDITEYTPSGTWPTDDILVGATADALDSTEGPDFCYTITVGTHGDYPKEKILKEPYIHVTCDGKDEIRTNQWEYYCNMLSNMDRFIQEYVEMFEKRGEPTLLIMFGDHLPTMGLENSEVATGDLFQTKYITWNNFGMAKQDVNLTSYQLVAEYLDRLGIHGGTMVDFNQSRIMHQVSPKSDSYRWDLQTLQYDLLYGDRYAYGGADKYPASDLVMGIREVVIDRAYFYNNKLHIYGDNFTRWSKVFNGDEKLDTTYESGQVLTINADDVKDGDVITVVQLGSSNTMFRVSNVYTIHKKES